MNSDIASDRIIATDILEASVLDLNLPDSSWDDARLLDYMRQHDGAIRGLERTTLEHEFFYGAACQVKYQQLNGKWTKWADERNVPRETFRRRRLVFLGAKADVRNLDKYPSKMECYWDLKIYPRPVKPQDDTQEPERKAKPALNTVTEHRRDRDDQGGGRSEGAERCRKATDQTTKTADEGDRVQGSCDDGMELIGEIEESRVGVDEQEVTVRLMASTVALIELLGEQERSDAGAVIFDAVREYAASHLDRKTWEKSRLGKSRRPSLALTDG